MPRPCSGVSVDAACPRLAVVRRVLEGVAAWSVSSPTLMVLVFDDEGLLIASRSHAGVGPAELDDVCAAVVELSPPVGQATACVVSHDPDFGTEPSSAVRQAFRDMSRRFERSRATLFDWWLVGGRTISVATACEEQPPW